MGFIFSILEFAAQPVSSIILALILTLTVGWIVWKRARLCNFLMSWVVAKTIGKKRFHDSSVEELIADHQEVQQFRLMTGAKAARRSEMEKMTAWCRKYDVDIGELADCGSFFDVKSMRLKPSSRVLWRISGLFSLLIVYAWFLSGWLTFQERLLIETKHDKTLFFLTESEAKPLWGGSAITPDTCLSPVALEKSGFPAEDRQFICEYFSDKEWKEKFKKSIEYRKKDALIIDVYLFSFAVFVFPPTFRGIAANRLHRRLFGPQKYRSHVRLRRLWRSICRFKIDFARYAGMMD